MRFPLGFIIIQKHKFLGSEKNPRYILIILTYCLFDPIALINSLRHQCKYKISKSKLQHPKFYKDAITLKHKYIICASLAMKQMKETAKYVASIDSRYEK